MTSPNISPGHYLFIVPFIYLTFNKYLLLSMPGTVLRTEDMKWKREPQSHCTLTERMLPRGVTNIRQETRRVLQGRDKSTHIWFTGNVLASE